MDSGNVRKKDTSAELVVAFCKDFARREEAIAQGNLSHRTIVELKYYNYKILEAAHPSPLSAYNGFFGCRHFSKTNELLREMGHTPIDWTLES